MLILGHHCKVLLAEGQLVANTCLQAYEACLDNISLQRVGMDMLEPSHLTCHEGHSMWRPRARQVESLACCMTKAVGAHTCAHKSQAMQACSRVLNVNAEVIIILIMEAHSLITITAPAFIHISCIIPAFNQHISCSMLA